MVMASRLARIRAAPVLPFGSSASGLVLSATAAAGAGLLLGVVVSDIACLAYPQFLRCPKAGQAVDDDGGEDEDAHNRLLPELVHPQGGEGAGDGGQEQCTQGGSGNGSAA